MMTKIIIEAEKTVEYKHKDFSNIWLSPRDIEKKLLIKSWIYIWEKLDAKALIIFTKTWRLARLVAGFRPKVPVYAFTSNESSVWTMSLYFWINGIFLDNWDKDDYAKTLEYSIKFLKEKNILNYEDKIIVINDLQKNGIEIPVMEIVNVKDCC